MRQDVNPMLKLKNALCKEGIFFTCKYDLRITRLAKIVHNHTHRRGKDTRNTKYDRPFRTYQQLLITPVDTWLI
jgi:hypothetical protein